MTPPGASPIAYGAGRTEEPAAPRRDLWRSIGRGLLMRCPRCGEGKLFAGFLASVDSCAVCDEAIHHHRADDLPPYLTVFIVGHLVVALFMGVEEMTTLPLWAHLSIWIPVTLGLSLGLLRPLKGGTIGLQWALRMHGFGEAPDHLDH